MTLPSIRCPLASLTLATLSALLPAAVHAQAGQGGAADGTQWGLGLFVTPDVRPYRDADTKVRVLPAVLIENRWLRLFGPQLEVKLLQSGSLRAGLTVAYAGDGYKPGDSAFLAGMARRKDSLWVGAHARLGTGFADLRVDWTGDASGHSQGQKLKLGLERRFGVGAPGIGALGITPRLQAVWHDRQFVQYYFGVEAAEARAGRPTYRPGSAVNTELGLRLDYVLAPQQLLFADLGVTALGSAIKASPIVERSTLPEARLGWIYRF